MCRWLAYAGDPIPLDTLLFKPCNSLIRQSLSAQRSVAPTNGDGFGLGWYGHLPNPGLYRDIMPAWNDVNLRSIAEQIMSPLFFAHVRASTGTATSRLNCHPFKANGWLFMHNGQIGGWDAVRQDVERSIHRDLYRHREGSTDSEALFLLALGEGMADDLPDAFARAIGRVLAFTAAERVGEPFRLAAAATDGKRVHAFRWSSDGKSPSLFYGLGGRPACNGRTLEFDGSGSSVLILSEPLDEDMTHWTEVPEGSYLVAEAGRVTVSPFGPH